MPVDYRQALTGIDRAFDQVQPGVFTSAGLAAAVAVFTWPAVPADESHVYENISFNHDNATGLDLALQVIGNQAGTSWSRVYSEWDGVAAGERINLLSVSSNRGGGSSPQWTSGGPLRLYSGEQLRVRTLGAVTVGTIIRFDWLRRIRESPFTFEIANDVVVVT